MVARNLHDQANGVLLQPLPYPEADRLTILTETDSNQPQISVAFPDYVDWRRDNTVFEHLAISRRESFNLSGLENRAPEQISGGLVTSNFFKVIGLNPQLGRVFTEEEDRVGGPMVCVISDRLWQRIFSRDPNVLGRAINFGNQPYTIIGVLPEAASAFPLNNFQVWVPRPAEVPFLVPAQLNGGGYFQHAIHVITLRWGKIADLDVFEDSQEVARALGVQAAAGLEEAVAEPILS